MLNDAKLAIVTGLFYAYYNLIGTFDQGAPIYACFDWFNTPVLAAVLLLILTGVMTWFFSTFTRTMNQCKVSKE